MRLAIVIGLLFLLAGGIIPLLPRWRLSQDDGYRDYTRVSQLLSTIPGVVVRSSWHGEDTSLDRFGFEHTRATTIGFELSITGRTVLISLNNTGWMGDLDSGSLLMILRRHIRDQIERDMMRSAGRLTNRSSERP